MNYATDLLKAIERSDIIEDVSKNMLLTNCKKYTSIDEILEFIQSVLEADIIDNAERSSKEGWEFYYFFPAVRYIENAF